jgi:16S rRNA (uracil1498-N3)-methyltransferase
MNDRMEWFLEKSVEIGIQEVTPILCHHSERKKINLDRFEKIMISAMQQSNRLWLPRLNPLKTFQEFIESQNGQSLFVAHCEDTEKTYLNRALSPATDATILIGPEGDFSTAEVEQALEGGAKPVALGDSRLRTETAAVYAVTAFNLAQIP